MGYEVSNRKWLQNDYDENGWVDSMQGELEPMEAYKAEYNLKTGLLRPLEENKAGHRYFLKMKKFIGVRTRPWNILKFRVSSLEFLV